MTPDLETERLTLRTIRSENVVPIFGCWMRDQDVSRYMWWKASDDINEAREMYGMRKRTKTVIRGCVLIIALGIGSICLFWPRSSDRVFDGSRVGNPDGYWLDFSYMDQSDSHTMSLKPGDILKATYEIKDGRIDVTIGVSGQDPIYRGNDVQTGTFELPIQEEGEYVISVNASRASGRLAFERKE